MGELGLLAGIFVIWCIALGHEAMQRVGANPKVMFAVAASLVVLGVYVGNN